MGPLPIHEPHSRNEMVWGYEMSGSETESNVIDLSKVIYLTSILPLFYY